MLKNIPEKINKFIRGHNFGITGKPQKGTGQHHCHYQTIYTAFQSEGISVIKVAENRYPIMIKKGVNQSHNAHGRQSEHHIKLKCGFYSFQKHRIGDSAHKRNPKKNRMGHKNGQADGADKKEHI